MRTLRSHVWGVCGAIELYVPIPTATDFVSTVQGNLNSVNIDH